MTLRLLASAAFSAALLTCVSTQAMARQALATCEAPMPTFRNGPSIFSTAQERDLGDAMAELTQRDYKIIDDDDLRGLLDSIGQRLTAHLPPATDLALKFHLIELKNPNAFVLPGGRVYVSRKLIAFARSEDELAGVIGHEIGHVLARQEPARMTQLFKEVLKVTAVSDRQDVFDKYKRLVDTLVRTAKSDARPTNDIEADQVEADTLGIFLVAAAGYDTEALPKFYERLLELNEVKASFFADLFGRTNPSVKRLRQMNLTQASTVNSCVAAARRPAGEFERWQGAVVSYTGRGTRETLTGVVSRTTLTPPLQSDLSSLRFSPDGRYILAQDTASISVLTRDPFKVIFTLDAPSSVRSTFSPDSRQIVFHTPDLRVQVWDVAEHRLVSARDVVAPGACGRSEVSPDGRFLACVAAGNLALYDVSTGERVLDRKRFFVRRTLVDDRYRRIDTLNSGLSMEFSPDARYFVAGAHDEGSMGSGVSDVDELAVYDLSARAAIELKGNARRLLTGGFSFAGPDRLVALNFETPAKSTVVSLPDGAVVKTMALSRGRFGGATKGPFAIYRPFQKFAVAIFDYDKGAFVKSGSYPAVDLYGDVFVAERSSGEVALYALEGSKVLATATLPSNTLGEVRTAAISPDLKRIAVSGLARGALWDLTTGRGIAAIPAFDGGHFATDGQLYIDVQPLLGLTHQVARVDPVTGQISPVGNIGEGTDRAFQAGNTVLTIRRAQPDRSGSREMLVDIRDSTSLASLWTQPFPVGVPRMVTDSQSHHVMFLWPQVPSDLRSRLKDSPALKKAGAVDETNAYLVEIRDARTGAPRGAVVVDAPLDTFASAEIVGGDLVVNSDDNRVVAYSIATGENHGQVFGNTVAVSRRHDLLLVENGPGRAVVYDYPSLQRRGEFNFQRAIAAAAFDETSTKLVVLTFGQAVVTLNVPPAR